MILNFYCGKVNSQGGSKVSLLNTLVLLKNEKQSFNVFVNKQGWFTKQLIMNGIDYRIIKEPKYIQKINRNTNLVLKLLYFILSLPKLIINWIFISKQIKNGSNVILNEYRDLILFSPIMFRKKVLKTIWMRAEKTSRIGLLLFNFSDRIIAVSEEVKRNIPEKYQHKVFVIYNFMNENPVVKNIGSKLSSLNLAVVGSIQEIKGQLDAVKVIKHLHTDRKIKLYLVGREFSSEYIKRIREYVSIEELNEQVVFTGHTDSPIDFLNENVGIVLVPSQTESFCRVAMEAASVGIPVVAYGVGGLKEVVIHDETGFLVKKDDIASMCEYVMNLMCDPKLYNEISQNARIKWKERFYSENVKDKLIEALQLGD